MKKQPELDRYFYIAGWIIIGIVLTLLLACLFLGRGLRNLIPPCFFHFATGYYCPGCGGTRAFVYFFSGHFIKSAIAHPFVPYTIILGGWYMISQTISLISKGKFPYPLHFRMIYMYLAIALILIGCTVKNILLFNGIDIMPV